MSEAAGGGGPGSKIILIIGLGIGILIGGGAMFFISTATPEPTEEELAEAAQKKIQIPDALYAVQFDRLTIGIYTQGANGRRRYLGNYFVRVIVEVASEDHKIVVERLKNRLQHGFVSTIASGGYTRDDNDQELDLERLAELLKKKANTVIGDGIVLNVTVLEALRLPN